MIYKILRITGFTLMFLNYINAQSPGGVSSYVIWKKNFKALDRNKAYDPYSFNYNEYLQFPNDMQKYDLDFNRLKKYTLVLVYDYNGSKQFATLYTGQRKCIITDSSVISSNINVFKNNYTHSRILTYMNSAFNGIIKQTDKSFIEFGNQDLEGDIVKNKLAEVIIFDHILNNIQKGKIESYLSIKYGISLPQESDYIDSKGEKIWSASKNTGYLYRVTAIGEDKNGTLDVRQSFNSDSEIRLEIGLGKISFKNKDNPNSLRDKNYLFWSDNGGELKFNPISKTDNRSFLQRIWKFFAVGEDINNHTLSIKIQTDKISNYDSSKDYSLIFFESKDDLIKSKNIKSYDLKRSGKQLYTENIKYDFGEMSSPFFTLRQNERNTGSNDIQVLVPNPVSKNEIFNIVIKTESSIDGYYTLFDNTMRVISREKIEQDEGFKISERVEVSGIYYILVDVNGYKRLKKLIVQ